MEWRDVLALFPVPFLNSMPKRDTGNEVEVRKEGKAVGRGQWGSGGLSGVN